LRRIGAVLVSVVILASLCALATGQQNVSEQARAHYEAGMAAKRAKNFDNAIFEFRLAIELEPDYLDANWALAWTYAALEDKRQDLAVEYFQKVIDLAPGTDKARQAAAAIERIRGAAKEQEAPAGPPAAQPAPEQPKAQVVSAPPCELNPAPRVFQTPQPPADAKAGDVWICPTDQMPMVLVTAGEFLYGPEQEITTTGAFWIDMGEVTNGRYKAFIEATGHNPPSGGEGEAAAYNWEGNNWPQWASARHPVTLVTREDAEAYARWAGKRLPTEQEWEKAARGLDGRLYPWGNQWDETKCVTVNTAGGKPLPSAGKRQEGASPWGVLDMAGNVWEWTASPWEPGSQKAVIRGGSCAVAGKDFFTTIWRGACEPDLAAPNGGFRCVLSAGPREQKPAQPQAVKPPVAIAPTAGNIAGTWRLKAGRRLDGEWRGVGGEAAVIEIAADGSFTHTTPAVGGGERKVRGTWELRGDQLTFTWLSYTSPGGAEKKFDPPRVYHNQASLYEGGRTLVLTAADDNIQQAWERQ